MIILPNASLLTLIYEVFETGEFTSRELSGRLREASTPEAIKPVLISHPSFPKIYHRFSRKMISNDLRRLYAMGFLKRRKVKRKSKTKSGKTCYRGYEYKYSLSSQGLKYLAYMARGGEKEEEWEGVEDLIIKIMLEKKASEETRDILWEFYQTQLKERKGFRRFSTSKMAFWGKVLERVTEILRDKKIKSLEERVKVLEEENKILKRKIEGYRNQEFEVKVSLQKFKAQFERMRIVTDKILRELERTKKENEELRRTKEAYKKVVNIADKLLDELLSSLPE